MSESTSVKRVGISPIPVSAMEYSARQWFLENHPQLELVRLPDRLRQGHLEFDAGCGAVTATDGCDVALCLVGGRKVLRSPEMARVMAAALLAAAAAAERDSEDWE